MRLFKVLISVWVDVNWLRSLPKSWARRGYWFNYRRPRPWVEQAQFGPVRFDVKTEWSLKSGSNTTNG